jgi:50S ribosomal protein L16 3-hydroxylase
LCVCHLVEELDVSQSLVSHHLKVLRDAGLVECERWSYWTYYRLLPDALHSLAAGLTELAGAATERSAAVSLSGGGVGPHCDSYDVFLLQGHGRRRWRVGYQRDTALVAGAPLKLLRDFRPQHEWVLQPGDMLYLPPGWGHDGVALDPCMTYSIGFRAPAWQELAIHFLRFLEDRIQLEGLYQDPDLQLQDSPARIARTLVREVARHLDRIRWTGSDVARFLGGYLTEPRAHVFLTPPVPQLSLSAFAARARRSGVGLDLRSQMLYFGDLFFINGETVEAKGRARESLQRMADTRRLAVVDTTQRGLVALLHQWYGSGYLHLRARPRTPGRREP